MKPKIIFKGADRKFFSKVLRQGKRELSKIESSFKFTILYRSRSDKIEFRIPECYLNNIKSYMSFFYADNGIDYVSVKCEDFVFVYSKDCEQLALEVVERVFWFIGSLFNIPSANLIPVIYNGKTPENPSKTMMPSNVVSFDRQWALQNDIYENDVVFLFSIKQRKYLECLVYVDSSTNPASFSASDAVQRELVSSDTLSGHNEFYVVTYLHWTFKSLKPQMTALVKNGTISIPMDRYQEISFNYPVYQVSHPISGTSLDITTDKIQCDSNLGKDEMRINRVHRLMLGTNVPVSLTSDQLRTLLEKIKDGKEKELINNKYSFDKNFIPENNNEEFDVETIFRKTDYKWIRVSPVLSSKLNKWEKFFVKMSHSLIPRLRRLREAFVCFLVNFAQNNLSRLIQLRDVFTNFLVGYSNINLTCSRPYDMDEDRDIVRISKSNLIRLGISENDLLVIKYRNKAIKLRAFLIDDLDQMSATNRIGKSANIDRMIGIPVYWRGKLGIRHLGNIGMSVIVRRSTRHVFAKNLNRQLIPSIALFIATQQVTNDIRQTLIIFLLLSPITIYIMLSIERIRVRRK